MSLIQLYLKDCINFTEGRDFWYVGVDNSVDQGIKNLLGFLRHRGDVLIGELEIFDGFLYGREVFYTILYQALPKLEYLEYMHNKVVKNKPSVKI